jgi:hypothetical protein
VGRCRLRHVRKVLAIAVLLLGAVVLAGCGESAQEKATAQVCQARSDISKQAKMLSELTISTNLLTEGKTGLEAIGKDLTKIKEAQPNLAPARKQEIQAATDTFQTQVSSIVSGLISNPSLSNAEKQIKSSLTQFATSFEHALAPIDCS